MTAGGVYRGSALGGAFVGRYLFGDSETSRVWSLRFVVDAAGRATATDLIDHTNALGVAAQAPVSWGTDSTGEWYIVSYLGSIYRLIDPTVEPAPPPGNPPSGPGPCFVIRRVVIGFVPVAILVPRCGT